MKNKKLLIGGASALSIATLSLGAFAFFSDSVELTKNTKVGSVDLSASAEIKHTQLKRNRANSDIIYGSELYDDIVGPEEITYPYYPESIDNARYPASWDIDFIENIQQTMDAFEEAPDNINPGDNYNYGDYNFYPGTDHELIVNIENTGTKSIQTRILFEISGTTRSTRAKSKRTVTVQVMIMEIPLTLPLKRLVPFLKIFFITGATNPLSIAFKRGFKI